MSTFVAAVVYGAFAVGYVAMLVLTERTAGRYVRGEIRVRHPRTAIVVTPAAAAPERLSATVPAPAPARAA